MAVEQIEQKRLEFGNPPPVRKKAIYTEEPFGYLRNDLDNLIRKTLEQDNEQSRLYWKGSKEQRRQATKEIFGFAEDDPLNASPSTISICVRRFGYEALGIPAMPIPAEVLIGMMLGTAGHKELLAKLARKIPCEIEKPLVDKEAGVSGRADMVFEHPVIKKKVVLDLKFVRSYHWTQLKRDEHMSEAVRLTKGVYTPEPPYELQLDLYMHILTKMGYEIEAGVAVYINRDSCEWKLAIDPWFSEARQRAEEVIHKTIYAREIIKGGGQPENIEPTAARPFDCKYCPFVYRCPEGTEFAGGKSKIQRRKRTPQQKAFIKKEIEAKKESLREVGLITRSLFTDDMFEDKEGSNAHKSNGGKQKREIPKNEPAELVCFDCGSKLETETRAIDDRKSEVNLICPNHGVIRTKTEKN